MRKTHLLFLLFLTFTGRLWSQATVRGTVSDASGELLIGAVVKFKTNSAGGVLTDLDGNFSIKVAEGTPQTLVVSYVSYKTHEISVPALTKGQVLVKNITLQPQNDLAEVEVVAKQVRANDHYMENVKINSATTLDYISRETMVKTGDPNVVSAIARVSGVSTSGGLITVRGIGDRYVKTTLNGSRIPTLDPLTNNIKLDLIPASLVDNIIITKTASPDLPADWSGAYLSVETKDYPEKLTVNVESQIGYNAQTTFKDYITSDRSSTDWLGFDNGLRNRNHTESLNNANLNPSTFDEMVALGLGNYYGQLGVTGWNDATTEGVTWFKMGLVQLGLLGAAQINDQEAFNNAKLIYNRDYKTKAFDILYPEGSDYNNGFKNNWNTRMRKAPLNFSQSFSIGNQSTLFKKPLGYIVGFRYGSAVRYDPNGVSQRVGPEEINFAPELADNALISRQTNGWSALFNLAYKPSGNHSMSFLFMPNYTGVNDVASYSTIPDGTIAQDARTSNNQFYEQRRQLVWQAKSEHYIPAIKMKVDYNLSYTKGNSIAPDFKVLDYSYVRDNVADSISAILFGPTVGDGVRRFYRYLAENILDTRVAAELPISRKTEIGARKLRFGGALQHSTRRSDMYDYYLLQGNTPNPPIHSIADIDVYLSPENFIMTNRQVDLIYSLLAPPLNFTEGYSTVKAAFAMLDYSILSWLRFCGGMRVEHAVIFADVVNYHELGFERNDPRRSNVAGYPLVNAANINEISWLPSGNLIFKLRQNEKSQMNFRLNYSQSLARPGMRELNDAAIYDNEFRTLIYGNSDLKTVQIRNYDFRYECYFNNGDNISASVFYKNFKNHIEMGFGNSGITWENVDKSDVKGIELEARKGFLKYFEARANVTFVRSNSQYVRKSLDVVEGEKVYTPVDTVNRPMFGQAPYIVNGILVCKADSIGLTITASYNVQGERLAIAGVVKGRPDVYEMPRHTIDIKLSQTVGRHFTVSVMARDVLNAPVRRAYKLPGGWADYDNFRYGTNFMLGIAYKL